MTSCQLVASSSTRDQIICTLLVQLVILVLGQPQAVQVPTRQGRTSSAGSTAVAILGEVWSAVKAVQTPLEDRGEVPGPNLLVPLQTCKKIQNQMTQP